MTKQTSSAETGIETVECPCCAAEFDNKVIYITYSDGSIECHVVTTCPECGAAIVRGVSEETAYSIVKDRFSPLPESPEDMRYYDMTFVRADGTTSRRHGWYDVRDSKIVQVG